MGTAPSQAAGAVQEPASYHLCARRSGLRLKLAEIALTLSDTSISYVIDGQTHEWPYSRLRSIRLQAVPGGRNAPWEATTCLDFGGGHLLYISSANAWGNDDKARDGSFIGFMEDLHRRLSPEDMARISFRRGLDDTNYAVIVVAALVFALIFGGGALFILLYVLRGTIPLLQGLVPIVGILGMGFWMYAIVARNRPGPYNPRRLPRELYPE